MKYGVTITQGATPWQIFQQNERGFAAIRLEGEYHRVHLTQEIPLQFSPVESGEVTVKARIALESSGESILPWTPCQVLDGCHWSVEFPEVPAGGLYRIETYMEYEGWDGLSCTRGDMVHNIGVGDVFVIAGQSNAAGRAKTPVEDPPELGVHLLRDSGRWDLATNPLGETTGSVHLGHYENHNPGQTPWLHFAKLLKRELGYPIGLVMCAMGGSPLRWWNPAENGALFTNMLEMLADYDLHPKAILWCQGEADGFELSGDAYGERFAAFVGATRTALAQPGLPFITMQINRCVNPSNENMDRHWGMVRQAQLDAAHTLENVWVVPSIDLSLYDFIHNSSEGNLILGERCARCALAQLYGRPRDWKAPEASRAVRTAPDTVEVFFEPVRNWLNPFDVPASLLPFEAEDAQGLARVKQYTTKNRSLVLVFERALEAGAVLHGAWRMDSGAYIPCDCMRMPMLAFYGLPITHE